MQIDEASAPIPHPLGRVNLSSEIRLALRRSIIAGRLKAGARLNEVELAARLGVSRTPLREALCGLVGEGFASSLPRRGFFVAELSAEEVREIYPIRQILDPEALRLAGIPDPGRIRELRELNLRIAEASTPEEVIHLDDRWHLDLVAGCGNRTLLDLIRQFMARTLRYELAYMSEGHHVSVVTREHERILDHLEAGDLAPACQALRDNMTSATEPLIAWLEGPAESETEETP